MHRSSHRELGVHEDARLSARVPGCEVPGRDAHTELAYCSLVGRPLTRGERDLWGDFVGGDANEEGE